MSLPAFSDNLLREIQAEGELASPEDVFLSWLLSLPDNADAPEAAKSEIIRLNMARLRSPRGQRLRELFVAAANCGGAKQKSN